MLMAMVDVLAEPCVQSWLPIEADGHVSRRLSFDESLRIDLVIPSVPGQEPSLCAYALVEELQRILIAKFEAVHVRFSPTIRTCEVALVDHRGHLEAGM